MKLQPEINKAAKNEWIDEIKKSMNDWNWSKKEESGSESMSGKIQLEWMNYVCFINFMTWIAEVWFAVISLNWINWIQDIEFINEI